MTRRAVRIAPVALIVVAGLVLSGQAVEPSGLVGIWANEIDTCRSDAYLELGASGYFYSECLEGTWSIEGSEIRVLAQNVVNEMCYQEPSPLETFTGTIMDVTPDSLTIHWQASDMTVRHIRCR